MATAKPTKFTNAPAGKAVCLAGVNKCFINENCISNADCFDGRWPCVNNVCVSAEQQFAQVATVCPSLIVYGKVKKRQQTRRDLAEDRAKKGNKNDQMRRSLVPAMNFSTFDNPMYGQQFNSAQQYPAREDEFYAEKLRGGGLVNSAGMNWRQSVMMSEAPQLRQQALARQQQERQFGGLQSGLRGSVMAFQQAVSDPLFGRMGRAVSRMYNDRQLGTVFEASSQGRNDLPDINKLFRHAELCFAALGQDAAQTMNINARVLVNERREAARIYRILAMFLKLLSLDSTAMDKVKDRIAQPVSEVSSLMNDGMKSTGNAEKQREDLQRAVMISRQLVAALTAFEGPFAPFNGAENWPIDSPEMLALDEYVSDCVYLFDEVDDKDAYFNEGACTRCCRKTANTLGIPDSIRLHPVFYFFYHFVQISLIISFFVGKCDMFHQEQLAKLNITAAFGQIPPFECLKLENPRTTYFGVPEQYLSILGTGGASDTTIPLLYGVMHSLLFLFGTLPVPMARGFWRDVAYYIPFLKKIFPIDTSIWFHIYIGYMALFTLFIGASIWMIQMGILNCVNGPDKSTCTAFDIRNFPIEQFFNPFLNVVSLRLVVIPTWGLIIPLMRWRMSPPFFLPQIFKKFWFEICYFLHIFVALTTLIAALACRFDVFFPTIAPWALYILDSLRETMFMTFTSKIDMSRTYIHTDPQDANKPTTMTIRFTNPERSDFRGGMFRKYMIQGAGTWVYLKVPSVSLVEWHPFSIASCTGDDFLSLQIGIKPGQPRLGSKKSDSWRLEENKFNGDKQWTQAGGQTWTYKLYEVLRTTRGDVNVLFRGPYGSTFSSIFDKKTKGSIIIGAGTGLSAVESCLRMMLYRKRIGEYVPPHVWVMWQARRVGDLLWLWDSLNQLLIQALDEGLIEKSKIWSPNKSQYLGWLGITFFISRADQNQLDTLRSMPRAPNDTHNVHTWLTNRSRILQSSMSNEGTHINKYVKHIRAHLNRTEGFQSKLAIGFCGPIPVAKIISDAASEYASVEFSYATE